MLRKIEKQRKEKKKEEREGRVKGACVSQRVEDCGWCDTWSEKV